MLFDSGIFAGFFALFLLAYFLVRGSLRARNGLIVLASFVFYGWWDARFLLLLMFTASLDFVLARKIASLERAASKPWLIASLAANLGVLGIFKYCNFFIESFNDLASVLGFSAHGRAISILLPVGISFYTFQSISYVVDVYRREIEPSRDWIEFMAYISFFPQLVAGPIERAGHLLPQFQTERRITLAGVREGVALMLFGYFKKIVIADSLAPFVSLAFDHPEPGGALILGGTIAFAFQIYCDFSGYSDIARGTARLLGFELMRNFNLPYLATSLPDFWRRWHISLSTWFRDYVYIPLGGNRLGDARTLFNIFIVMLLAGLWHGARWNFLLWGAWHALGLILFRLWKRRAHFALPGILAWCLTMAWTLFGWMLFRAESVDSIWRYIAALGQWDAPNWMPHYWWNLALLCAPLLLFQILARRKIVGAERPRRPWARAFFHGALLLAILVFCAREEVRPFIYFQF